MILEKLNKYKLMTTTNCKMGVMPRLEKKCGKDKFVSTSQRPIFQQT